MFTLVDYLAMLGMLCIVPGGIMFAIWLECSLKPKIKSWKKSKSS